MVKCVTVNPTTVKPLGSIKNAPASKGEIKKFPKKGCC